jgi:hypothetical protein
VSPIFLFLITIFLEISNDFFSKILLENINQYNLLFLRNFFSLIPLFFLTIKLKRIDWKLIFQIFVSGLVFFYLKEIFFLLKNFSMEIIQKNIVIFAGFVSVLVIFYVFCRKSFIVWRSIFSFLAFNLTTFQLQTFSMYEIASTYFSIPIFSSILSFFIFDEKIRKLYICEILILSYLICKNFSLGVFISLCGCFCFSVCDIFFKKLQKSILEEAFFLSLALSFYFFIFSEISSRDFAAIIVKKNAISVLFLVLGSILMQSVLPIIFRKISFVKLMPFRFLSLICCNIIDGNMFSFINFVVIIFIFIEIFLSKKLNK